jgi:hypothetical protein
LEKEYEREIYAKYLIWNPGKKESPGRQAQARRLY